jgi:beta-galactosidase
VNFFSPQSKQDSQKKPASDINFNKNLIYMFLKKIFRVAMLFLSLLANGYCAGREQISLVSDWKFLQRDIAPDENRAEWKNLAVPPWENVSIPHTWNSIDGANGREADPSLPEGYYRGPAWYERALPVPTDWRGRRVFIRFEGVSLVADVFINRIVIGQHRGAFGAFCFEVTPYLKFDGSDSLRVRVDNARALDVAPLSGDFTVFGGIYRPVEIFSTGDACISPTFFGSPGVFLTLQKIGTKEAEVEVKTLISSAPSENQKIDLEIEIKDADGLIVAKKSGAFQSSAAAFSPHLATLKIPSPRLWQGTFDPYLYSVTVQLKRGGELLDEVRQPLGIRTVAIDKEKGFLLNEQPYALHGVNRHQERTGKGWALSNADHDEDHALIREVGANTVRLAHYQQAKYFHDLSDRFGIITWEEIPLVDAVSASPEFLANARQQLQEMVYQNYNHPSVAMWGLFNELDCGAMKSAPAVPVVESLQKLAKEIDPTRPTVAASFRQDAGSKHKIADAAAWNIYPGWYSSSPDDAAGWIESYRKQMGSRIGISEYGAGANPAQFAEGDLVRPVHNGAFHPQEWQNYFHERLWAQLQDNPNLWGTWIWAMFDFAVDKRNEGGFLGLNDKGLVSRDRKTKKDTFYFYKANWNPEPMVRISSHAATPRTKALTEVKVYSNCAEVELIVNGKSLGKAKPDAIKICRWSSVNLQPGTNTIQARANGEKLSDTCEWTLEKPNL